MDNGVAKYPGLSARSQRTWWTGKWQGPGTAPTPRGRMANGQSPGLEPSQGVPHLSASPAVPSLLDCTLIRSCSSRLVLEKLTPAPRHCWAHRNIHQGTQTGLGMEVPARKPDFLFLGLETLRESLGLSLSPSHCIMKEAARPPPRGLPHALTHSPRAVLPLEFPTLAPRVFPGFSSRPWPGQAPGNMESWGGTGAWLYGWHLLHPPQPGSHRQCPHFTAGKTEAQRGEGTCLQSHGWKVAELGLNPDSPLQPDLET